jgi:hypothetical protein
VLMAQTAQGVANTFARELALLPLPASATFEAAIAAAGESDLYREADLVVDLDEIAAMGTTLDQYFATLPLINQALRPLMIFDPVVLGGEPRRLLRVPGALWIGSDGELTVKVPFVRERDETGVESIEIRDFVEECKPDSFAFETASLATSGLAAVRLNVAFQAAAMSSFRPSDEGPYEPNLGNVNVADDAAVTVLESGVAGSAAGGDSLLTTHSGAYGLGAQQALGKTVRPFRRVIVAQAIVRREAFTSE